jgi:MarR family transcriptional regulator for hemolysin
MSAQGLVTVRVDDADRRKRLVSLTAKGARLKKPVLDEIERVSLDAYTDVSRADMQAALRVFRAIESRLERDAASAGAH